MRGLKLNAQRRGRCGGVALVVALILLAVLTLVATTGVRMSVAELWMAGNEQFHRQAVDAASAGVEITVARIGREGSALALEEDAQPQSVGGASEFTVSVRRVGQETMIVGSSVGRLTGEHFEIESVGASARDARDVQVQGVMVLSAEDGVMRFSRIGSGLPEGTAP